jgi:hypothetical protein
MIPVGDRISTAYVTQQKALHASPDGYGHRGHDWAVPVARLITQRVVSSVLDYGCGQGSLVRALKALPIMGVRFAEYDPAIPGKDGEPGFADLVVCTDVLEHVEPDKLDAVLAHLKLLARRLVFAVIALRDATRTLPDGRNAHLIIETADWWRSRLARAGFTVCPGPTKPGKPARELSVLLTHAEGA